MSEKREIFFAKLITLVIFFLLCLQFKAYAGYNTRNKITRQIYALQ